MVPAPRSAGRLVAHPAPQASPKHGGQTATPCCHTGCARAFLLGWRPARPVWCHQACGHLSEPTLASTMAPQRPGVVVANPQPHHPAASILAYPLAARGQQPSRARSMLAGRATESWHAPGRRYRGPGRRCRRPAKARPQLLGQHLDHRVGAAVVGRPGPLLEPAHDHDPAAPSQGLGHMLGLVAPHDPGEDCLAGRSALPVEPGDGGHRGMPASSGQTLHPGRDGRTRLPPRGPLASPLGASPGRDWPVALATGGCEPRLARTRLGRPPAPCRHSNCNQGSGRPRGAHRSSPHP
jgi:hypothetical protein